MKKLILIPLITTYILAVDLSNETDNQLLEEFHKKIEKIEKVNDFTKRNFLLGKAYFNRHLTLTDYKKALEYFKKANTNKSKYYLGLIYLNGLGVKQNVKKGIELLKEANTGDSLYELGKLYIYGKYVLQNPRRGVDYLKKAAKKDNKEAKILLGTLYINGFYGINKNLEKAAQYIFSATNNGTNFDKETKEIWEKYKLYNYIK